MGEETWLQWLLNGEKLVGLVLAIFTIIGTGITLFWRNVSNRVKSGVSGVATGQAAIIARLDEVERDVGEIQGDMRGVKDRVAEVEKGMSTLATSKELATIDRHMAGLAAKVDAQGTTLRMIYEAAMRADTSGRKQ